MDKKVFASILMALKAGYPRYELQSETIDFYFAILGDLPQDLLKAATLEYARREKWFPTAAELREQAFDIVDSAEGKIGASEAWGLVISQVRKNGYYREPEFDEPLIYRALDAVGGWRRVCMTPEDVVGVTEARFLEAFKQFRNEERTERRMLPQVREVVKRLAADRKMLPEGGE